MRGRALLSLVATAGGMGALLSYRTPRARRSPAATAAAAPVPPPTSTSVTAPDTVLSTTTTVTPTTITATTRSPETTTAPPPVTVTGPAEAVKEPKDNWQFGVVQVQVTEAQGRLTRVGTTQAPPDGDTGPPGTRPVTTSITAYSLPKLEAEAMSAQGAHIATVSGATYTSDAFIASLQAALAQLPR